LRGDVSEIHIGENSNIQDLSVVHVEHTEIEGKVEGVSTVVGDNVTVGHRVILHACTIGNAVLIGMGAIVLDGAVIGDESIVGAGSLVTKGKKFPPRSLLMGSPAKVMRELIDDEIASLYKSSEGYVRLKNAY
jgi:carbonic anhydrase/acetyltransferase-like protein (isoleucine patch superfamily)